MPDRLPGGARVRAAPRAATVEQGWRTPDPRPIRTGWTAPPDTTGAGADLGDLADVDTAGETTGDVLAYDGDQWRPAPASRSVDVPQPLRTVQLTHDLGFDPAGIRVVDTAGSPWDTPDVSYPVHGSVVELRFDVPFSGVVHLS